MSFLPRFPRAVVFRFLPICLLLGCTGVAKAASSAPRDFEKSDDEAGISILPHEEIYSEGTREFEPTSRKRSFSPVAELLYGLPLLNDAQINPKASYVLCLYSASWCGPCRRELPGIVARYLAETDKGRHKGNMEVILFDFDHSEADARAWIAKERVPFPVTYHAPSSLPGARSVSAIPTMIALDMKGTILMQGSPAEVLSHWDAISKGLLLPVAPPTTHSRH